MDRRAFMISVGGAAAGMVLLPRLAEAAAGRIDWYTSSDQNVLDFWTNFIKGPFEAANPGVTLNLVDAGDNAGNLAIADRALAALQGKTDPQADYFENFDPRLPAGAIDAGLYVNIKEAGLSNWSKVNPLAIDTDYSACPTAAARCCSPSTRRSSRPPTRRRPSPTSSPGSRRTPASSSTTAPTRAARAATSSAAPSTR